MKKAAGLSLMMSSASAPGPRWWRGNLNKRSVIRLSLVALTGILAAALAGCAGASDVPTATRSAPPPDGTEAAEWSSGARMPTPRSEMPAVLVEGRIYVPGGFGGLNVLEWYDPVGDEWHVGPDLPAPRHHLMAAAYKERLFVFGGGEGRSWRPTDDVWAYDAVRGSWENLAPMPEARLAGAAVTVGDRTYVAGGVGESDDLLVYAPESDRWRRVPGPSVRREHVAAVQAQGDLWLIAGRWRGEGERRSTEIYSAEQADWRSGPDLLEARAGFAAAAGDGRILAAGGELLSGERRVLASVEAWSSEAGEWRAVSALPDPVHGFGSVHVEGRWYFIGGSDVAGGVENAGRVQILTLR